MRKRNIKYPLIMNDDIKVRTLEDLQMHFDLERTLAYFENGKLVKWLYDRYEDDIANQVMALDKDSPDVISRLCDLLGVKIDNIITVSMDSVREKNEVLERVKRITDDKEVISNFEKVAFSQEELDNMLKSGVNVVYLYGQSFSIEPEYENVRVVGVNNPEIMCNNHWLVEYDDKGIVFEGVNLVDFVKYSIGDIITIGGHKDRKYQWRVLEVDKRKILVISQFTIKHQLFDNSFCYEIWENSSIRKYLSEVIYNNRFNEDERAKIMDTRITNIDSYGNKCNDTTDKLFLLSKEEAKKYFISDSDRIVQNRDNWWLRSEGRYNNYAAFVNEYGEIDEYGQYKTDSLGIRPVMYISINNKK